MMDENHAAGADCPATNARCSWSQVGNCA